MIRKDMVVSLAYILKDNAGEILDEADSDDPFSYLHGHQQIVPGLEDALEGLNTGAKKQVQIKPEDGYGDTDENLKLNLKKDVFPKDFPLEEGTQFQADLGQGRTGVFTITTIKGDDIAVDGNHPLAGVTLNFDITVLEVRPASKEELSHGHVHGKDGHDH